MAEDLGEMFDSVRQLLADSGFPGMKVLQFAFTGEDSVDLPHNYPRNCVAYPGTHDNNTLAGWFGEELTPEQRQQAREYFALNKAGGRTARHAARRAWPAPPRWRSSRWPTGWRSRLPPA